MSSTSRPRAPLDLHYTSHGQGRPLLFIHGFGASSYSWQRLSPELSKTNRVLLLDLKGHGASPKPVDTAYSLRDQAELVAEFINQHDLRDLTLVGHSMGGGVALLVALKFIDEAPGRLSSMILIDTVAYSQELPRFIRLLRVPLLGPLVTALTPASLQARLVLKLAYFDDSRITEETVAAYSAPLKLPGARHALVATAKQIIPENIDAISSRYPRLKVPSLILWGSEDEVISVEIGRRLHQALPSSRFAIIQRSGHIPQEETPDQALTEIQRFLNSCEVKAVLP
jgi:pimeloyl-ACP methyl ester carboxylesterase